MKRLFYLVLVLPALLLLAAVQDSPKTAPAQGSAEKTSPFDRPSIGLDLGREMAGSQSQPPIWCAEQMRLTVAARWPSSTLPGNLAEPHQWNCWKSPLQQQGSHFRSKWNWQGNSYRLWWPRFARKGLKW
jgi:hypothetical protein